MRLKRILIAAILGTLIIFSLFAMIRTVFNVSKLFTEERSWVTLSNYGKRKRLFGDIYDSFLLTQNHTQKNANILFLTTDSRAHYLAKYYLYPRIITVIELNHQQIIKSNYDYVAVFLSLKDKQEEAIVHKYLQTNHNREVYNKREDNSILALYQL